MNNTTDGDSSSDWILSVSRLIALVLCPTGIVSSILTMCTLWANLIKQKNSFFIMMFTISVLDSLFNITYIVHKWGDTLTFAVVGGITFSVSLASDLCAFLLTLEKYAALCWPEQMRNISERRKRKLRAAVAALIPFISFMRLQYIGGDLEDTEYFTESVRPSWWSTTYLVIAVMCDMILPFILSISMGFLSCRIISVVVSRYRSRAKVGAAATVASAAGVSSRNIDAGSNLGPVDEPVTQGAHLFEKLPANTITIQKSQQEKEKVTSAVSQVLILDAFFMLNQLGYCGTALFVIYREVCEDRRMGEELLQMSYFASDTIECVSHAFNFYFYVRFSKTLRTDFLAFVSRMKSRFF